MASVAIVAVQVVVVLILWVLYCMNTYSSLRRFKLYLPPATVMIVLGLMAGAVLEASGKIQSVFEFDPKVFFNVLLPPIIFFGGLTLPKETFFRNLGSILTFAFAGTVLASFVIGGLIHASGSALGVPLSFVNSMVLGSLLAAVDPVSTISVFKSSGVTVSLYTLVMGESVLNDAVSIVINREFVKMAEDEHRDLGVSLGKVLGLILGVTIGSILFGVAVGLLAALVHKHARLREPRNHHIELAVFFSAAYLSFVVAEESRLSGIMSALFCAIVMDHYTVWNLSEETRAAVHALFEMLAEVAESFVFVYLGMAAFTFGTHSFHFGFAVCVLLYCVIARFLSVFPLAAALNRGRKRPIPAAHQGVMFLSGLRGAVAFALALEVPLHRDEMVTTTLFQVFVTILCFGGATYPALRRLGLTHTPEELARAKAASQAKGESAQNVTRTAHWFVRNDRSRFRKWFRVVDAAGAVAPDAEELVAEAEVDHAGPSDGGVESPPLRASSDVGAAAGGASILEHEDL